MNELCSRYLLRCISLLISSPYSSSSQCSVISVTQMVTEGSPSFVLHPNTDESVLLLFLLINMLGKLLHVEMLSYKFSYVNE